MRNTTPLDLSGFVSLAEAASRLPSPRPGKKTHCSTVYRIAKREGLEIRRRGPYRFVRWTDLVELFAIEQEPPRLKHIRARPAVGTSPAWVDEVLRENGLR